MSGVVGYWGAASGAQSKDLINKCTEAARGVGTSGFVYPRPHSNFNKAAAYGIAWWGDNSYFERRGRVGFTASLSASGIPGAADIRIEIEAGQLTLSRDAFGRATLYWTQVDEVVWFSSRLDILLAIVEAREVSLAGLYGYGCFSFVPAPLTPVENVFAVSAGSKMTWRAGESEARGPVLPAIERTTEFLEPERAVVDEAGAILRLRGLLEALIRRQLEHLPAGPVGVFLSGGLDSSITAALLVRAGVSVRAYTLDFGAFGFSELPFAELVADALSIPLVKVPATPREIHNAIEPTAMALDTPFGDGVTAPLFLLSRAASRDTNVVFNGEGGDQLFGGWTNKPLIASSVYGDHNPNGGDFEREYLRTFHRLHGYEQSTYAEGLQQSIARLHPFDWLADALDASFTRSLLHRLRRANLMIKGAQNIQPRATALGLAHGLAVRTPFCDRALAEWTFEVAGELHLRGPCEKYLLKRAVEDWLPAEIVWREKRGMGVPLTSWCLGPLWRAAGDWLTPGALESEGRFQPDLALRIASGRFSGHVQGRRIGEILWLLLMWEAWRKTVLKEHHKPSYLNSHWLPARWLQWRVSGAENL